MPINTIDLPKTHYSLTELRVRYVETDAMGIVHHSVYFPWFEVGRTDFGHQIKVPYTGVEKRGINYPLAEAFARYKSPARYDDRLLVKTWLHEVRSRSFIFEYEIHNPTTDSLIAAGYTKHMVINADGKVTRLPDDLFEAYRQFDADLLEQK